MRMRPHQIRYTGNEESLGTVPFHWTHNATAGRRFRRLSTSWRPAGPRVHPWGGCSGKGGEQWGRVASSSENKQCQAPRDRDQWVIILDLAGICRSGRGKRFPALLNTKRHKPAAP